MERGAGGAESAKRIAAISGDGLPPVPQRRGRRQTCSHQAIVSQGWPLIPSLARPDPRSIPNPQSPIRFAMVIHSRVVTMAELTRLDGRAAAGRCREAPSSRRRSRTSCAAGALAWWKATMRPANRRCAIRIVVGPLSAEFDPATLTAAMVREGFHAQCSTVACLIAAVDKLAADVSHGRDAGRAVDESRGGGGVLGKPAAGRAGDLRPRPGGDRTRRPRPSAPICWWPIPRPAACSS